MRKLYWNTVTPQLKETLLLLMNSEVFNPFRLVGGTALSLQIGHRLSVDIDLFTDADYGSIDFEIIYTFLKQHFNYVDTTTQIPIAFGKSYYVGSDKNNLVKLDVFYTDKYFQKSINEQGIRMASIEEIIAMKMDVIQRNGRKKDFWDIHELIDQFSLDSMLDLHKSRYPYSHDRSLIISNIKNCSTADNDFNPICLKNKYWQFIKLDMIHFANTQ